MGLGVGFELSLDPVYVNEISPAMRRGRLVKWSEIAFNVGILLDLSVGLTFYKVDKHIAWRCVHGAGATIPPKQFY